MRTFILALSITTLLLGCASEEGQPPTDTVIEADVPEVDPTPQSAVTKRLSVDMLEDSLAIVAGTDEKNNPIQWQVTYLNKTFLAFGQLGTTLGRPDYAELTSENLEPNALYIKFVGDMAINVCGKILQADQKKSDASDRVMTRFIGSGDPSNEANLLDNLRYLKLRFLAEKVADDDDAGVADLKVVYDQAHADAASEKSTAGWNAVCVALFNSPSFHLY
jgi:hypothetical protein